MGWGCTLRSGQMLMAEVGRGVRGGLRGLSDRQAGNLQQVHRDTACFRDFLCNLGNKPTTNIWTKARAPHAVASCCCPFSLVLLLLWRNHDCLLPGHCSLLVWPQC